MIQSFRKRIIYKNNHGLGLVKVICSLFFEEMSLIGGGGAVLFSLFFCRLFCLGRFLGLACCRRIPASWFLPVVRRVPTCPFQMERALRNESLKSARTVFALFQWNICKLLINLTKSTTFLALIFINRHCTYLRHGKKESKTEQK